MVMRRQTKEKDDDDHDDNEVAAMKRADSAGCGVLTLKAAVMFLLIWLCVFPATPAVAAGKKASPVQLTARVVTAPSGRMEVRYEVRNTGQEPVYHVTVTAFLGQDARRSDPYGQITPGQAWTSYSCDFDPASMLPGNYILVSRVTYDDQAGRNHSGYDFYPFLNRSGLPAGQQPPLEVTVAAAPLNAKSIGAATTKYRISLTNNHKGPVQAVLSFYLPDGIVMDETERFYELGPGGTQHDEAPVRLDAAVPPDRYPYRAVLWYTFDGVHYSRLLQDEAPVEERPVLLIAFTLLTLAVAAGLGAWRWWRRRSMGSGL
jgi:hypothetical protein